MRLIHLFENATDRKRARKVIQDWQHHKQDFFNTQYWQKRFAPFEEMFSKYKPSRPVELFRSERTDINNKYEDRYSSWSWKHEEVENFGWKDRRLVVCTFNPADILVSLPHIGLDSEAFQEVIVKPGNYHVRPFKLAWDNKGFFNYYDRI